MKKFVVEDSFWELFPERVPKRIAVGTDNALCLTG